MGSEPPVSRELTAFVEGFVVPLLTGHDAHVGRPLRPRERDQWSGAGSLHASSLLYARLRRARMLVADPDVPEPDGDELSLWMALHNVLVFDHPDRPRVWARSTTWRRLEGATRTLLTLPTPSTPAELVVRHVSVGAFIELQRRVHAEARLALDDERRMVARAGLPALPGARPREETTAWLPGSHAPETERLIEDVLRCSPLTCLLRPLLAPPGWSPLGAADLLLERPYARAICHGWAAHKDWTRTGGAVIAALLPSLAPAAIGPAPARTMLALPGAVVPTDPEHVGALVAALVHLHLLKVLELDTRVGLAVGSRDPGILAFLALPLLLPQLEARLGAPIVAAGAGDFTAPLQRRWSEYIEHLDELVPRAVVENLLATLVPRIVQPS